ncbi:MYOSIN-M HEAVY PROTEIN [Salix koriyanagi]|uniref:MYOSIN-M HEAVY PROTEIN n=1 Tax=Salix koriyanagi TaxID=2511006 RepID=A0A9Q0VGB2_9ROSI|nr:MYOSIN-M HEAVY PROTEIN [Salix koriyanagi]
MGKQNKSKSKKSDSLVGKGKVTPLQIAFIVDRYLSDNNLSQTRSIFRTEASPLISKSPVREAPKTLLSLGAILNDYICLKEQKVVLDQERVRLEQEKLRIHFVDPLLPQVVLCTNHRIAFQSPHPRTLPWSIAICLSITNQSSIRKRIGSSVVSDSVPDAKKSRSKLASRKIPSKCTLKQSENAAASQVNVQASPVIGSSSQNCTPTGPIVQASNVAKSLFQQPLPSPPTSSSNPNTPPQSFSPHNVKSASPKDISANAHCSNNNTPQQVTPTSCTVITSERVTVSPFKNMTYYTMERNQCISSSSPVKTTLTRMCKRDCVKGRLDFDGSDATVNLDKPVDNELSTSESDKDVDFFDLDLPNLDVFGANFSFSELLVDLDLDCEETAFPCQPAWAASTDTISGSSHESRDGNLGTDQVMSEFSSTMTEVISGNDMHMQGPDITAVKSITKCIRILSPAKSQRSSLNQENCLVSN